MVSKTYPGADGYIRKVRVMYRNSNESVDRTTTRASRELIMIHPVDEISLFEELQNSFNHAN